MTKFFSVRVNLLSAASHTLWQKKFRESNVFTIEVTKELISWTVTVNFCNFHTVVTFTRFWQKSREINSCTKEIAKQFWRIFLWEYIFQFFTLCLRKRFFLGMNEFSVWKQFSVQSQNHARLKDDAFALPLAYIYLQIFSILTYLICSVRPKQEKLVSAE